MKKRRFNPTLSSHVYSLTHAKKLISYIRTGGNLADEDGVQDSLQKATFPRARIEERREEHPLDYVVKKICRCCSRREAQRNKSYCDGCSNDLACELYHLKRAFASFKPVDNKCFLCERVSKKQLHLDHDHFDGKARSFLCDRCNCTIGLVEKDLAKFREHCRLRFGCDDVLLLHGQSNAKGRGPEN